MDFEPKLVKNFGNLGGCGINQILTDAMTVTIGTGPTLEIKKKRCLYNYGVQNGN